ncbi:MAG: hypothetical protein HKN57_06735, partial [Xanthomonadales bacterium]|nr:hypothetical protein [Xanthomonadales bacterium]
MNKYLVALAAVGLFNSPAMAGKKPEISVMTQNQYLGADLTPIIAAGNLEAYKMAVVAALLSVSGNNFQERARALAKTIKKKKPHLVGLQEVFEFGCIESGTMPGACDLYAGAFNDHLAETMTALDELGAEYTIAAVVKNLDISPTTFPLPGLPVYLDAEDNFPAFFVTVIDRDVILARNDVLTKPLPFNDPSRCNRPSLDGCNFDIAAATTLLGTDIEFKRGFVGVKALVKDNAFHFVNTHLEVQYPAPDPTAPFFQAAQASQLLATVQALPMSPGTQVIVVGDINSSQEDVEFPLPPPFSGMGQTPYAQFEQGVNFLGQPDFAPLADAWLAGKPKGPGYTCCELPDLSNAESMHDERI